MNNSVWRRVVLIIAGLGVLGGLAAVIAVGAGLILTSARPPHSALTTYVLHTAFKQSVARGAGEVVMPAGLNLQDPGLIRLGAAHYADTCASCHGGPGLGQSPLALSMRPSPQHLPAVVGQFTDAELFWIIREGVRFSPMPAWPAEGNFDEVWAVVAFLRQLPGMTAGAFAALRTDTAADAPVMPWGATGPLASVTLGFPSQPVAEYAYSVPTTGWTPIGMDERPLARCVACHGADGSGAVTGGFAPNLTILTAQDISDALHAYAQGRRESGIMAVVASSLSGDQIAALATHFADTLPDVASPPATQGDPARGMQIANLGKPDAGIPPCLACHAEAERARFPLIRPPGLAGQSARYLAARLDAFAEAAVAEEGPPAWQPMRGIAVGLSATDRADVAAYFAGLAPGQAPEAQPAPVAPGDAAVAEGLVTGICSRCHTAMLTGDAPAAVPNLTGQTADFLALQLWAFHEERRSASQMLEIAEALDGAQITALANHVAALPHRAGASVAAADVSAADRAAAERLIATGDAARNVPACSTCHDATARPRPVFVPRLDGQGQAYLERRLATFAEGRGAASYSPMTLIAPALTEAERKALSQVYAGR